MRRLAGRGMVAVVAALATVSALATGGAIPARAAVAQPDMARIDPSLSGGFSPLGPSPPADEALAGGVPAGGGGGAAGITPAKPHPWGPPGGFFVGPPPP